MMVVEYCRGIISFICGVFMWHKFYFGVNDAQFGQRLPFMASLTQVRVAMYVVV